MANPTVEQQEKLVARGLQRVAAHVSQLFEGPEHKPFRLMVKRLLPLMAETPASPSEKWHDCFPGGLLVHNDLVIHTALSLVDTLWPSIVQKDGFAAEHDFRRSVVKVGFLHDLGKIGNGETPYYVEQDNEWRRDKLGEYYHINFDNLIYLPVPQRALWLAANSGVLLTEQEYQAVIASDGPGTELGRIVRTVAEAPLTSMMHFADLWASQFANRNVDV